MLRSVSLALKVQFFVNEANRLEDVDSFNRTPLLKLTYLKKQLNTITIKMNQT